MEGLLAPISPWYLISLGLVLLLSELLLMSFVLMWFGIAAILMGLVSFYIHLPSGESQLIITAFWGGFMLYLLRHKMIKSQGQEDMQPETFREGGYGQLKKMDDRWMVEYQGTLWKIAPECLKNHQAWLEDDEVNVVKIQHNQVFIEKQV